MAFDIGGDTSRPMMSMVPQAAKGMIKRSGRVG